MRLFLSAAIFVAGLFEEVFANLKLAEILLDHFISFIFLSIYLKDPFFVI
jgi:hypothetical protein